MTDLPAITLPAEFVVPAWRNAALASGDDPTHPTLYRTVLVEWFSGGLQFVATDGHVLIVSWASDDRDDTDPAAPERDEAPLGSIVAIAADRLMVDFCKHRAAEVKAWRRDLDEGVDPEPVDVTFSLGTINEPDTAQQRLDIGDRRALIISADNERIALPLYEGDYPSWRSILTGYKPTPRAEVKATAGVLARLGQLRTDAAHTDDELQLTMARHPDGGDLVLVTGTGRVPLEAAFVPHRDEPAEHTTAA
jgi:hypothetical protein